MTATRTTVETKRVTLYVCPDCGEVSSSLLQDRYCECCKQGPPKPIEYAPLPSEETRTLTLNFLRDFVDFSSRDLPILDSEYASTALAELSQAWSGKP